MRILIVGIGALGGIIATRAIHAGIPVKLATRTADSAAQLRAAGLRVSGVGGAVTVSTSHVALLDDYEAAEQFELIILATKAHAALELGSRLKNLLAPGGVLLPIQNGGVSQMLADQLQDSVVVGALSNLGGTMVSPGRYEQRNAGYLLIGELTGGLSERTERLARVLRESVAVRTTTNLRGAIWSKLLLNCSVTTLGAIAGCTMRDYMAVASGREIFRRIYDETLTVAHALGVQPERMMVEPIPPGWTGTSVEAPAYLEWVETVLASYGDLKPSMLQDFERGRQTEIDFINGYVARMGIQRKVSVRLNQATTTMAHAIEAGRLRPAVERLDEIIQQAKTG